ncbi:hypothetical protein AU476_05645 [Cupriavidus sp. UYMSc13B]|nr:hypothetical protein AU476_05645 [Cupriavidus sp. UYMSc13B]
MALVPWLVDEPVLLMAAIACWTGTLLYLSLLEPAPRNYICLLAAYTLPIVAAPTVTSPATVFDVANPRGGANPRKRIVVRIAVCNSTA